jgi:hypothetical protein
MIHHDQRATMDSKVPLETKSSTLRGVAAFGDDLAFHIAREKFPHVSPPDDAPVKLTKPNGMKL